MYSVLREEGFPVAMLATLLAFVEGSIGSQQYMRLYVEVPQGDQKTHRDVIENGRFPCALFTSCHLIIMGLIKGGVHTNVTETIEDLHFSGWYEIDEPRPGAVIIWGPKMASDKKPHRHIGFYLGNDEAVSTDGVTGLPVKHHVTYGTTDSKPNRVIEAIYFHNELCP